MTVKIWDNAECKKTYGNAAPGGIMDHMLCAGKQGKDSCSVSFLFDKQSNKHWVVYHISPQSYIIHNWLKYFWEFYYLLIGRFI